MSFALYGLLDLVLQQFFVGGATAFYIKNAERTGQELLFAQLLRQVEKSAIEFGLSPSGFIVNPKIVDAKCAIGKAYHAGSVAIQHNPFVIFRSKNQRLILIHE